MTLEFFKVSSELGGTIQVPRQVLEDLGVKETHGQAFSFVDVLGACMQVIIKMMGMETRVV